ncbi:hypothetical protein [Nocardioides aestuarii]|uniref:Uncharacterized protein n=1 Tax=Nocardioides aestuarii TaxID=252231 RepID=A0ABW4TJR2_9ACTN
MPSTTTRPAPADVPVVGRGTTSSATGTNGYVSTWGALQAGCPRPVA